MSGVEVIPAAFSAILTAVILACPGDMAARLSRALSDYNQERALKVLLEAGLREATR